MLSHLVWRPPGQKPSKVEVGLMLSLDKQVETVSKDVDDEISLTH